MKKSTSLVLTLTLALCLILSAAMTAYGAPGGNTKRLFGNDRFETSIAISQYGWPSSDYVIISTGEGDNKFADALAGAPIAKLYDAPMLLTNTDGINTIIADEIERLGAKNAIILGGTSVVSADAEAQLVSMGLHVERLWGQNRCETAVKIANRLRSQYNFNKAILTTGYEFQYALMAAPFASKIPILFSEKNTLTETTKQALTDFNIDEVDIIGGTNIISDSVMDQIEAMGILVSRVDGNSLESVNINVVKKYNPSPSKMALARNNLFADALSGASYALKSGAPIFLVGSNNVASSLKSFILNLNTTENYIFGGPAALSNSVVNELIPSTITLPPIQIIPDINIVVPGVVLASGNTSGNIGNRGIAAVKGDWIFFSFQDGLYKIKNNGTGLTKVCEGFPLFINVVGDFVYFSDDLDDGHIYRVKTDGTMKTKISDDEAEYVTVLGDMVYYRNMSDSMPYKVKVDGTGRTKIGSFGVKQMTVSGEWIYFITTGSTSNIYRMKVTGTGAQELINKNAFAFDLVGDDIYYIDKDELGKIYKANISSPNSQTKITNDGAFMLNVSGGYIYYAKVITNLDWKLYKIKTDGTGDTKLKDEQSGFPNIAGEWIYYANVVSGNPEFHKMKLDGTQDQLIP